MTRLTWDNNGRKYESGLSRGVLYLDDGSGVAWNGLTAVSEEEVDFTAEDLYFDGRKRRILQGLGHYKATLSAITYPDEFAEYNGLSELAPNQVQKQFGFSYRTEHDSGYKIHLVYNVVSNPSARVWRTHESSANADDFVWDISTVPEPIQWCEPAAHFVIDTTAHSYPEAISQLEDILYGTPSTAARLPSPDEIVEIFESHVIFRVTYNGDGTWTATGPDSMFNFLPDDVFQIISPSAFNMENDTFKVRSY